ncbi:hypothetical protein [Lacrimispora sp.]|jgi:hypothetical protein|uniref:hypothetical protein n=1 Tax=Lacrimispora sp. TaxID=2719234 RepID=UPI0028A04C35|nr:hypothetical protein [Lacrimispora sp.]
MTVLVRSRGIVKVYLETWVSFGCKKQKRKEQRIMAKRVSNMNELAAALKPTMLGMIDEMTERVYQTLNYFLQEYYNDYNPKYYRRQYDFCILLLIKELVNTLISMQFLHGLSSSLILLKPMVLAGKIKDIELTVYLLICSIKRRASM